MSDLDHSLLCQARKFVTGANVHYVKTWVFCYETSAPDSPQRQRYDKLLREFAAKNLSLAVHMQAKLARDHEYICGQQAKALDERDSAIVLKSAGQLH